MIYVWQCREKWQEVKEIAENNQKKANVLIKVIAIYRRE